jgi:hypothetical protein
VRRHESATALTLSAVLVWSPSSPLPELGLYEDDYFFIAEARHAARSGWGPDSFTQRRRAVRRLLLTRPAVIRRR